VEGIEEDAREARVTLTDAAGAQQTLAADAVMQAIGFAPRVEGYGLENTGVALTEGGAIDVNGRMQTSVPHLYAVGDVTMKKALANVAESMGIIAAENIAGAETVTLDYRFMPSATYCQPQIASFGYTEAQAREAGYRVLVMGDFNTAPQPIDLARPKQNRKNSGFLPEECDEFQRWLDAGWIDTFRALNPDTVRYSWWKQAFNARERNVGWRIDLVLASRAAMRFVERAFILTSVTGSDHCPVGVDLSAEVLA